MKRWMEFRLNSKKVILSYNEVNCNDVGLKQMFDLVLTKARKKWPKDKYFFCYLYNEYLNELDLRDVEFRMSSSSY